MVVFANVDILTMEKTVPSVDQILKQLNKLSEGDREKIFLHLKEEFQPRKKRGSKISDAYNAITYEPQDFQKLIEKFNVSPHVMRHYRRFDPFPERGRVKSSSVAGKKLIWREKPNEK